MAAFTGIEVHTDVACNGGVRKAWFPLGSLLVADSKFALAGEETAAFAVHRADPQIAEIVRGRVARYCTTDPTDFVEWRIADLDDGGTGEEPSTIVTCLSIASDLSSAPYETADGEGVATTEYALADATATDVLDGPVRDALDSVGRTWIVTGNVDASVDANVFGIDGADETAQQIVQKITDDMRAPSEFRLRRNGTTDYRMDLLEEVGSTADPLFIRTGVNLQRFRRKRLFADSATRLKPRGQDDGTGRSMQFAFWEITAISANTYIEVIDPRGGTYPGPAAFADQYNGKFLCLVHPTFTSEAITDTTVQSATTTRFAVASTTGFTVGDYVELRLAGTAASSRLTYVDHPAAQALYGIFPRILDLPRLTGAVNFAPNPFVLDTPTTFTITAPVTATIDASVADPTVSRNSGSTLFTTRVYAGDILLRASDDAVIGTVLSVTNDNNLELTANSALNLTNQAWKVQKDLPAGWTGQTDDATANYPNAQQVAPGFAVVAGSGVFSVLIPGADSPCTFQSPIFPVNKDHSWRLWVWVNTTPLFGDAELEISVRRVDTGAQIGDAVTLGASHAAELNTVVSFLAYDLSPSATGVRLRFVFTNPTAIDVGAVLGPVGCAPASWARRDVYAPIVAGFCANDLVHAANERLATMIEPSSYDIEFADREQIDAANFPDEALAIGQTVHVHDDYLNLDVEQRVLEFTRDYLTHAVSIRLGSPRVVFGEFLNRKTKILGTDIERAVTLRVADTIRRASALIVGETPTLTEAHDGQAFTSTSDQMDQLGKAMGEFEAND